MGLETVTYIDDLVRANPTRGNTRREADNHLRIIKEALLATFSGISGAVTVTHTELNLSASLNLESLAQIGNILPYGGDSAPSGFLLCNGAAVDRTTYSDLFGEISTVYGIGDGATTFNVPDMQGNVPFGKDSASSDFTNLADSSGSKTHTLTLDEAAAHSHAGTSNNASASHTHNFVSSTGFGVGIDGIISGVTSSTTTALSSSSSTAHSHTDTSTSVGAGTVHSNLQPYVTLNYIIKT